MDLLPSLIGGAVALAVAIGLFAFLLFSVEPAEAASMTFTSDTTITTNQTIASLESWVINGGVTVTIASGVSIQNNGTIWNEGILINNGTLVNSAMGPLGEIFGINNAGSIINYGTLNSSGPFRADVHSSPFLINNGTFNNAGPFGFIGSFTNYNVTNNSGQISMDGGPKNFGMINNDGSIIAASSTNSGTIINSGEFGGLEIFNSGTIINFDRLSFEQGSNSGTINNNGTFSTGGDFGFLDNGGTINNNGTLTVAGDVAILNNLSGGIVNNNANATIDNFRTYNNVGTTNNAGSFNNKCGGTFSNTGTFTGNPLNYELCITLEPASANNPAGANHTVTATVTDSSGTPQVGILVTFNVTSGPNIGTIGTNLTDSSGYSTFTYLDTGGAGTDIIRASFNDQAGIKHWSNVVIKTWVAPPPPPPPYSLGLKQGTNNIPDGGTAEIGIGMVATAITNSSTATQVNFTRINPDSSIDTEIVPLNLGSAQYTFTPTIVGRYSIIADFGNGVIVEREIDISFSVIPESPIGIVALMASSIAALGGFILLRKRRSNSQPHSLGDLGI